MKLLFETQTLLDLKENQELNRVKYKINLKRKHFVPFQIGVAIISVIFSAIFSQIEILVFILFYLLLLNVLMVIMKSISYKKIKKVFDSYKISHNLMQNYCFYEEYFTVSLDKSQSKIEYRDLYEVIETKNRYYLFLSKIHAFVLIKDNIKNHAQFYKFIVDKTKNIYHEFSN